MPALRLTRLAARGFRNLQALELETDARFVVLHGENAQGKTNALEAIYLLATLKPLRGHRVRDLIGWESDEASVVGHCRADLPRTFRVDLSAQGRVARVDGDRVDLAEYFTGIRAIAFTPADGLIVTAEPARRRAWLDRAAFTDRPAHLDVVRAYRRILVQKSAVLRSATRGSASMLEVLDTQLAQTGAALMERRIDMLRRLAPHVRELHEHVAGGHGVLELAYRARTGRYPMSQPPPSRDTLRAALVEALAEAHPDEVRRRRSLVGPQTDEVVFSIDGNAVRTFGSQGQVRSVVLALKLAELVVARGRGVVPLFLLDDVGSELDRGRTERLVHTLTDIGGQVFVTTTDPRHVEVLPGPNTAFFRVSGGVIRPA